MQTFLPSPLFQKSAECLDDKRLGKQRVECLQLLNTLSKGEFQCPFCKSPWSGCDCIVDALQKQKTPWHNHPAAQMWKGFEKQLAVYGLYVCNEWIKRGFKDTCFGKIQKFIPEYKFCEHNPIQYGRSDCPAWLGDSRLHASHRSNLLRKNPVWYRQFGWTEPSDMEYFWPTKNAH